MANSRDFQINFIANIDISNINANVGKLQNALSKLKLSDTMSNNFRNLFNSLNSELTKFETKSQSSFNKASDVSALEKSGERITTIFNQIQKEMSKIDNKDLSNSFTIDTSKIQQVKDTIAELQNQIKQKVNTSGFSEVTKAVNELNTVSRSKNIQAFFDSFKAGDLTAAGTALNNLQANVNKFTEGSEKWRIYSSNITILQQAFANLSNAIKVANLDTQLRSAQKELNNIETTELNNLYNAFNELRNSVPNVINEFNRFSSSTVNTARSTNQLNSEISQLQNQVTQFFSLGNAVQLFKRAVRSAFEDVKELDKSMTETAVVTDFSVGDMWDQLPQYTEMANELGVSILGAYDAATLYYQQGLQTNEVMAVSTETLKMARIAGMEAADATNLMTAALRGFNMEVNEVNSQRINDVYSELAAITAADTEEIGTAMSKTASIAASANMEFETTAALLSQIIETTREAPETAGTAMKTIIARFSEVKNLVDQGVLTGTDEEGEVIDVNKIQTALKSVGISMNEFFAGTEGLDDILLELAEKWDTLDFTTQRYIATTAAGSRQQSRFIAMMSDYGRTQELVQAAYNSTGASQEQFEKTLDSLESKLEQLGNAWTEFTTGITNSSIIKFFVDALTTVLNIINDVTGALGDFGGGIAKLLIAFAGIKIGKSLFNKFFTSIGTAFFKGGQNAGVQFNNGLNSSLGKSTGGISKIINNIKKLFNKNFWVGITEIPPVNSDNAITAFNNLKKAQADLQKAQTLTNNLMAKGALNAQQKAAADSLLASLSAKNAAAEAAYAQALGLSANQQASMSLATQLGVSADTAAIAAKAGLTTATIQEYQASLIAAGMSAEEAKQKTAEMIATTANTAAQNAENAATNMGILTKAKYILQLLFGTKAARADALSKLAEAGATWAAKGAQDALNASMLASPVGWIAVAIMAVVAAVTALAIAFHNASDEAKLENLNEQIEAMDNEVEEAKSSIDELTNTKTELDELQDSFEGLTKGTQEWKEALVEVNQRVLELVNQYPKLAEYIEKGAQGQLTIQDEGWDRLIEEQQERYNTALTSSSALNMQKLDLQQKMNFEEVITTSDNISQLRNNQEFQNQLNGNAFGNIALNQLEQAEGFINWVNQASLDIGGFFNSDFGRFLADPFGLLPDNFSFEEQAQRVQTGGLTEKEYSDFAALAAERGLSISGESSKEEFRELYNSLGYASENFDEVYAKMQKLGDGFDELANQALSTKNAEEAMQKSMLETIATNDEELSGNRYAQQAIDSINAQTDINEEIENARSTEKLNDEMKQEYADAMGMTLDEVNAKLEDKSLSEDTIKTALATNQVQDEMAEKMRKVTEELTRLEGTLGRNSEAFNTFSRILLEEGQSLTQGDIDLASSFNILQTENGENLNWAEMDTDQQAQATQAINAYLESIGTSLEELGVEAETIYSNIYQGTETMAHAFDNANKLIKGDIIEQEVNNINNALESMGASATLTAGQTKAFADSLADIMIRGGNIENFSDNINKLLTSVKSQDNDALEEVTSILSSTDWSNADDIDSTISAIEELGIELDNTLVSSLYNASAAVRAFNMDKIEEELDSLNESITTVEDKIESDSATFSQEEFNALIELGIDDEDFYRTGIDEYTYIGGTTNSLLSQLNGKVDSILGIMGQDIEKAISTGELFETYFGDDGLAGNWNGTGVNNYSNQQMVEGILNGAIGVGTSTNVSEGEIGHITPDTLKSILNTIGINSDTGYNIDSMNVEGLISTLREAYQNYLNLDENRINQETAQRTEKEIQYSNYSSNQLGTGVINSQITTTEGTELLDEDKIKLTTDALKSQAIQAGVSDKAILEYEKALNDGIEANDNSAIAILANAIALRQSQKAMGDTMTSIDDLISELENIEDIPTQIEKVSGSLDDIGFGSIEINEGNLNYVIDLLDDLRLGSYDAYLELSNLAAQDFHLGVTANGDFSNLNNAIQFSNEQFIAFINDMIKNGAFVEETVNMDNIREYIGRSFMVVDEYDEFGHPSKFHMEEFTEDTVINGAMTIIRPKQAGEIQQASAGGGGSTHSPSKKSSGGGGGGGGGGGSSKKENTNKWENPYDEYYNLTEQINELLRQREYLERRYDRILENRSKTAKDLYDNIQNQLASLQQEEKLQKQLLAGRQKQLQNIGSETYIDDEGNRKTYSQLGVTKYARYDMNSNRIIIDWKAINKVTDEEKGAQIEDYISRLEELVDMYEETEDTLDEISDQVEELKNIGRDEYLDLEQRVYDAIVAAEQEMIDNLSETAELINESNTKLINSLQEAIDEERQARENERTEEDIQEKQRRLELLRRDTSGANALEILQLEEEISDAQESYTDSLIDQKINELQEQNDEAYEQRQEQIDLLQHLLDYNTENGEFWKDAHDLITKGIKPDGSVNVNSDMYKYLANNEGWNAMSQAQKDNWADELTKTVKQAVQFLSTSRQLENIGKKSGTITFTNANGQTLKGTVNSKGQVTVTDSKGGKYVYDDVYQDYSGAYRTLESSSDASYIAPASKKPSSGAGSGKAGGYFSKIGTYAHPKAQMPAKEVKYLQQGLNAWLNSGLKVDGIYGSKTIAAVKTAQKKLGGLTVDGYWGPKTFAAFKKSPWKSYQTGGLADFTGPAWLDGTKSKPELVLNAQDTQNFIVLKDILSDILKGGETNNSENGGDNYFEIHIEVDELGNDYDVEQVADKVKRLIVDDARYRNNNAINLIR
jgi:TP901 family phage tail tape measure protein